MKKFQSGFTLIELLLVFSLIAILSAVTFAAFSNFGRTQKLNNAVQDVVTAIQNAKASAQTQHVPTGCSGLIGYKVVFSKIAPTFDTSAVCGSGSIVTSSKKLSSDLSFTQAVSVQFNILDGGTDGPQTITIKNTSGNTKSITVGKYGQITISP